MKGSCREQLLELFDGGIKENTFESYLKRTYCAENLYFYRKVIVYESLESQEERNKMAMEIWNTYVAPDSEEQVNLDGAIVDGRFILFGSLILIVRCKKKSRRSES